MQLEQIVMFRDTYLQEATKPDGKKSTLAEYIKFSLDGGVDVVTSKDCVIFDDENQMLHAICINEDMRSQYNFPVKVISSEYAMVQQLEAILSTANFKKYLDAGYISSMISEEKKEFLLDFVKNINNQAQQPLEAEPYFNKNPKIIPKPTTSIEREKYTPSVASINRNGQEYRYDSIKEMIDDIQDGDHILIIDDVNLGKDEILIDKEITATISLNGKTIKSSTGQAFNITKGNLTITGPGSIDADEMAFRLNGMNDGNPTLTIDSDVVVKSNKNVCIFAYGVCTANIYGILESNGLYATISGNGSLDRCGTTINIDGANIISTESIAIYQPQSGTLNIKDSTISGVSAIYVKSGNVNIEGESSITANGEFNGYKYNPSGAYETGDALIIDFCDYPGGDPIINIKDGLFRSLNANGIEIYSNKELDLDKVKECINITGGTFNNNPKIECIEDGYIVQYSEITKLYNVISKDSTFVQYAETTEESDMISNN